MDDDDPGEPPKSDVIKEHHFLKLGGGLMGLREQNRILKLHENGKLSYYDGKKYKKQMQIDKSCSVGIDPKNNNQFYVNVKLSSGEMRLFNFKIKKNNQQEK